MTPDQNRIVYLKWLAKEHPDMFRATMAGARRVESKSVLGSLGWINFVIQAVAMAGSALLQKKQIDQQAAAQKKALLSAEQQANADRVVQAKLALLDANTKRAQAGLPIVDINGKVIQANALATPSALVPYAKALGVPTSMIPGVPNNITYVGGGLLVLLGLLKAARVI
jgi:hypothetical protein